MLTSLSIYLSFLKRLSASIILLSLSICVWFNFSLTLLNSSIVFTILAAAYFNLIEELWTLLPYDDTGTGTGTGTGATGTAVFGASLTSAETVFAFWVTF